MFLSTDLYRNPKAPWREHFLNLDPSNWERYDIDWPEFNAGNLNYLNIGIPPVVSQNYRSRYMFYWNQQLPSELNRTIFQRRPSIVGNTNPLDPTRITPFASSSAAPPPGAHVIYYSDKTTEDPIRMLQYLLQHPHLNRSELHQVQSISTTMDASAADASMATPSDRTYALGDNHVPLKADSTFNILIGMVVLFLIINVIIFSVYGVRRIYYNRQVQRKLDVLSLDGTTDDDLKRSKFNDGDESFILDIVRRKNEYVPVKRYHSPIHGFLLSRHCSTSTMDTHTKVSDWISHEVNRQTPKDANMKSSLVCGHIEKISVAMDGTKNSHNIKHHHPVELTKSKSFEYPKDITICDELDVRRDLFDSVHLREAHRANSIPSLRELSPPPPLPRTEFIRIDHRPARSDPVALKYSQLARAEDVTSFIEDVDINVTSRDECDGADSYFTMSPQETLQVYEMRKYPKVLPEHPNGSNDSEYVSTSSFKRRSMPSHQFLVNQYGRVAPPLPPPRTTSTLGRNISIRSNSSNLSGLLTTTSPVQRALLPTSLDEEPEIAYNVLHVGPLLPGSKENLYSTVKRSTSSRNSIDTVDQDTGAAENPDASPSSVPKSQEEHTSRIPQLKPCLKFSLSHQYSADVACDVLSSRAPMSLSNPLSQTSDTTDLGGNSSEENTSNEDRKSSSGSSTETASSTVTIKQIF